MEAQAKFTKNYKEIEKAEKLELDIPNPEYEYDEFLFRASDVKLAFKNDSGDIVLHFGGDDIWSIKYDEQIWNELKYELNKSKDGTINYLS